MPLNRWKMLCEMTSEAEYTSPGHSLSQAQALQLFHVFLLQIKEYKDMVYVVEDSNSSFLVNHLAQEIQTKLNISSRTLPPIQEDLTLPLSLLLKKNDLLIILSRSGISPITLGASGIARELNVPLITLSGGKRRSPLRQHGDLNIYFNSEDEDLIDTGQYLFLKHMIETWPFEPLPSKEVDILESFPVKLQTYSSQITL